MYYIGMMSGTSLDGIDAVLARYDARCDTSWSVIAHSAVEIPAQLKNILYQLNFPCTEPQNGGCARGELHQSIIAERELTECYAEAYRQLMSISTVCPTKILGIGAHGQTIRHEPNAPLPYTLQLLDGALLSYLTGQHVVCDFRRKDMIVGGQGAPLAPLFHQLLFNRMHGSYAVVNIGGIANISVINGSDVSGFDCGPGNCMLDDWITQHVGLPFDNNGSWASQGVVLHDLLSRMLSDDYFQKSAPKSTGRDYFNYDWLRKYVSGNEAPVDVMRTLVALTATSIAQTLSTEKQLIIVGGGAKNRLLCEEIESISGVNVVTSDEHGIDAQTVEALGFALLAEHALSRKKVDTRSITGAQRSVVLGTIHYAD